MNAEIPLSLFKPVNYDETDPVLSAFNDLKLALQVAQETGLHTHEAQVDIEEAFQRFLLLQGEASYNAGWSAAMRLHK